MSRGTKFNARLLLKGLQAGIEVPGLIEKIEEVHDERMISDWTDIRRSIIQSLKSHMVKTYRLLERIFPMTNDFLETTFHIYFSKYTSFTIFGCNHSTDVDVILFVDRHSDGTPFPLLTSEYERFVAEMAEIGYTDPSMFDINMACIEDSNIIATTKGGAETQNMIIQTFYLHSQRYTTPKLNFVVVEIIDRLRSISKFILNQLEYLVEDYASFRDAKKEAYGAGVEAMLNYTAFLGKHFIQLSDDKKWIDTTKSLTMKYCQLIMLMCGKYAYTKEKIVDMMTEISPVIREGIEWFLFRGKRGVYDEKILPALHSSYVKILTEELEKRAPIVMSVDITSLIHPRGITEELFREFLSSPQKHTDFFETLWETTFSGGFDSETGDVIDQKSIGDVFPIPSSNTKEMAPILGSLMDNFIFIEQRSPEWMDLLNFYECGKNSKNIADGFAAKYNLIRGAITELLVMDVFDPSTVGSEFVKCFTGFIVESPDVKGSPGCAPDMLLVSPEEIIPIEIKTLKSGTINSDYYRGVDLAKRQCQSVRDIILKNHSREAHMEMGIPPCQKIERGIILLTFYEGTEMIMHMIQFDL